MIKLCVLLLSIGATIFFGCATSPPTFEASIAEKIEAREPDFRKCYASRPEPRKNGLVRVSFVFDGSGVVTSTKVKESTLGDPVLESCVLSVLRSVRFPTSIKKDTVEVTYPFRFSSK